MLQYNIFDFLTNFAIAEVSLSGKTDEGYLSWKA